MAGCKCRYCQNKLLTNIAYKVTEKKQVMYFCDEKHYELYNEKVANDNAVKEAKKQKEKEERELKNRKKQEEHALAVEKYKKTKDKVYYLICEIIGRKEIIHGLLWKEWAIWNKVATNEVIGQYLEENKNYLCSVMSKIADNEVTRIKYFSAILKNKLGDYKPAKNEIKKPQPKIDAIFYEPIPTNNNKRRSLADLEDDF